MDVFKLIVIGVLSVTILTSFNQKPNQKYLGDLQTQQVDSIVLRKIFDQALSNGEAYSNLEYLCTKIGHRLSGSEAANQAVNWTEQVMLKMGLDTVYKQPINVPYWQRGDKEFAAIKAKKKIPLNIKTLGGSVSSNGTIEAQVIEVRSLAEIAQLGEQAVKGKIVFYNRPMDPNVISTFEAYGGCVDQRYWGAVEAAKMGAVAVLVRSMTTLVDDPFPHTGSMGYKDGVNKIPSAAISTKDAKVLHQYLAQHPQVEVAFNINPTLSDDAPSYNVIGEIKGSKYPERIMVIGGHLDSWDVGQGAHDDGAGIVHSMEVLRILKSLNYKPNCTIRAVMYMNEENGNMGGKGYAKEAKRLNENHIVAIESDRGGFSPRGFSLQGDIGQLVLIQSFRDLLEPYGLHFFEMGHGGVDIGPLADKENMVNDHLMLLGLIPDSQRYFDYHHSEDDVFENVNRRELELGCGSLASMIYLLDQHLK